MLNPNAERKSGNGEEKKLSIRPSCSPHERRPTVTKTLGFGYRAHRFYSLRLESECGLGTTTGVEFSQAVTRWVW